MSQTVNVYQRKYQNISRIWWEIPGPRLCSDSTSQCLLRIPHENVQSAKNTHLQGTNANAVAHCNRLFRHRAVSIRKCSGLVGEIYRKHMETIWKHMETCGNMEFEQSVPVNLNSNQSIWQCGIDLRGKWMNMMMKDEFLGDIVVSFTPKFLNSSEEIICLGTKIFVPRTQ